jgi:hypothetical protein
LRERFWTNNQLSSLLNGLVKLNDAPFHIQHRAQRFERDWGIDCRWIMSAHCFNSTIERCLPARLKASGFEWVFSTPAMVWFHSLSTSMHSRPSESVETLSI